LAYCTVNNFAPVVVPPAFVNEIFLELVPAGTVIRIKFALRTLTPTAVVPTKCDPCTTNEVSALKPAASMTLKVPCSAAPKKATGRCFSTAKSL